MQQANGPCIFLLPEFDFFGIFCRPIFFGGADVGCSGLMGRAFFIAPDIFFPALARGEPMFFVGAAAGAAVAGAFLSGPIFFSARCRAINSGVYFSGAHGVQRASGPWIFSGRNFLFGLGRMLDP